MELFKVVLIIIFLSISAKCTRPETSGQRRERKSEAENLSVYLKTIGKLISNYKAQKNGSSFDDMKENSVTLVKSLLVDKVDHSTLPSNQRLLMLETIKDLQKLEYWLAKKEPVIREIEDYCEALVEKDIFKNGPNSVIDLDVVLKYIEELNSHDEIDKNKLKTEIDGVIEVLMRESRHMPEIEKLVDYLEVRRCIIDGVRKMDRYIEKWGFTIKDMNDLRNITKQFAPVIDLLLSHKRVVKDMNKVYSSLAGKTTSMIENSEDGKKMSLMLKLEMFSYIEKIKGKSTRWSKLIEEFKHLNNL